MAEPRDNSSLYVFLNYEFALYDDHPYLLGTANNAEGRPYLVSLAKNNLNEWKESNASPSLQKIVRFVLMQQEIWLQENLELKPILEYQLAWLERIVNARNAAKKRKIVYRNPCRWQITAKIVFPKAFDSKYQNLIISKNLQKKFSFDRLATRKTINDRCWQICQENFQLKVHCTLKNCCVIHRIKINAAEFFEHFTYTHVSLDKYPYELYIPLDSPANDETITIEATDGNKSILAKYINNLHKPSGATNNSLLASSLNNSAETQLKHSSNSFHDSSRGLSSSSGIHQ